MTRPAVSFTILLPLLELTLWVILVAGPTTLVMLRLEQAARKTGVATMSAGAFSATIPRARIPAFAVKFIPDRTSKTITAANLPAIIVEILVSLPTSWPSLWLPQGLTLDEWRALVFLFFCLPAWLFAGRGVDGLILRRPVGRVALVAGSLLSLAFAVLGLGLRFGLSAKERGDSMGWVFWGFGLWAILFGLVPCAWLWQRRSA